MGVVFVCCGCVKLHIYLLCVVGVLWVLCLCVVFLCNKGLDANTTSRLEHKNSKTVQV